MSCLWPTIKSLNLWITIVIVLALVNNVTSGSKSWMAYDPGAVCLKYMSKVSLFAQRLQTRNIDYCQEVPLSQSKSIWTTCLRQRLQPNQTKRSYFAVFLHCYVRLAIIIIALHVTTRSKFELWLAGCETCQTNTPQHAKRSVPENIKLRIIYCRHINCHM